MSLLLHIPHSSKVIPYEYRDEFKISDEALKEEVLNMTDSFTDDLFPRLYPRCVYPVSRLVSDPERFRNDEAEPMARKGMGAVYSSGYQGSEIRECHDKERVLSAFYDEHHRVLAEMVEDILSLSGKCTIVDCHSFSSAPLPYEDDKRDVRPEICIGTDSFHTPPSVLSYAIQFFLTEGFTVALNRPYSGSIVPMRYYGREKRVESIMIEVNRGLYLDCRGGKSSGYGKVKETLSRFCSGLSQL